MKNLLFVLTALILLLPACKDTATQEEDTTRVSPHTEESASDVTIILCGGDDMEFDKTKIKVKEGQIVKLILKHTGKAPVTTMRHNFVLLSSGVIFNKFAAEALHAKDNDYIPAGMEKDVIAHTPTIGGGESTSIEFTAPAKGTYDFLCSFPGHAVLMRGKFIVE